MKLIWATTWQNQQNECVPSEDSDQPGNPPRPVWSESLLGAQWVANDPCFLHADSEDYDQSGGMSRLTWVFAGRTCHFVGFVMVGLKYFWTKQSISYEVKTFLNFDNLLLVILNFVWVYLTSFILPWKTSPFQHFPHHVWFGPLKY